MPTAKTTVDRVRFRYEPISTPQLAMIGAATLDSVKHRIQNGLNLNEQQASPLKPGRLGHPGYPDIKLKKGLRPIRDWTNSGATMRAAQATAGAGEITLAFNTPQAEAIARVNNAREPQWGLSEHDSQVAADATHEAARENFSVVRR